jgi:branched-chain amino acid transport system ATP-binding protein
LGLAPRIVEEIFRIIVQLKQELGKTVLIVEQNAAVTLEIADWAYVMETGRLMLAGTTESVRASPAVQHFYLGLNEGGDRCSYRDPRQARRRALASSITGTLSASSGQLCGRPAGQETASS